MLSWQVNPSIGYLYGIPIRQIIKAIEKWSEIEIIMPKEFISLTLLKEDSRITGQVGFGWWYLKKDFACPIIFIQTFMIFKNYDC